MNRIHSTRTGTASRLGKRPYLYAHTGEVVGQTTTTNTAPPSSKTFKRMMDRAGAIPSHWQQVVA